MDHTDHIDSRYQALADLAERAIAAQPAIARRGYDTGRAGLPDTWSDDRFACPAFKQAANLVEVAGSAPQRAAVAAGTRTVDADLYRVATALYATAQAFVEVVRHHRRWGEQAVEPLLAVFDRCAARLAAALPDDADGATGAPEPGADEPGRIVGRLRQAGRTVRDIAETVGVSTSTVYRWAAGACRPRTANLAALTALALA